MKSHEVEDAQGMAPLGGRASRPDVQGCGGHSGRKGTRMNPRPSQRASGHLWLQPGSGDKQEDFVQWEAPLRPPRTHRPRPVLLSLLGCELMSAGLRTGSFSRMH